METWQQTILGLRAARPTDLLDLRCPGLCRILRIICGGVWLALLRMWTMLHRAVISSPVTTLGRLKSRHYYCYSILGLQWFTKSHNHLRQVGAWSKAGLRNVARCGVHENAICVEDLTVAVSALFATLRQPDSCTLILVNSVRSSNLMFVGRRIFYY